MELDKRQQEYKAKRIREATKNLILCVIWTVMTFAASVAWFAVDCFGQAALWLVLFIVNCNSCRNFNKALTTAKELYCESSDLPN